MNEDINQSIATAEKTVKKAESEFGTNDARTASALEDYARLLRTGNRIMDAVDAEWRARAIRTALSKVQPKDGWIDLALGQTPATAGGALTPEAANGAASATPSATSPVMPGEACLAPTEPKTQSTDAGYAAASTSTATTEAPSAGTSNTATMDTPSAGTSNTATMDTPPAGTSNTATMDTPPAGTSNTATMDMPSAGTSNTATMDTPSADTSHTETPSTPVQEAYFSTATSQSINSSGAPHTERNLSKKLIAEKIASGPQVSTPALANPPAQKLSMRTCPHCQAAITDYDIVCNYCHTSLVPPTQQVENAGFWMRAGAFTIDYLILYVAESVVGLICFVVAMVIAAGASSGKELSDAGAAIMIVVMLVVPMIAALIIEWLYEAFCTASSWQGTVGKLCLGIKVTDLEGRRIGFWKASARHFAKILSGLILCVGYFMAGWTENKQALHDIMAGTLVVKKNTKSIPPR